MRLGMALLAAMVLSACARTAPMPTTVEAAEVKATADFAKHADKPGKATCLPAKPAAEGHLYFECKPADGGGLMFIRKG